MIEETMGILDEYARWIRDNMHAAPCGEGVKIVGPMLDRNNDFMTVYLERDRSGDYVVTDLGETIGDLEFSGCGVLQSPGRRDKLSSVLKGYGVERSESEIFVRASRSDLVPKMNMLFQAMASVDDLFFTSIESVRDLFEEDVRNWMLEHDIRAVQGPSFTGKSGLMYKFDFAIAQTKRQPERLVKIVKNPSEANVKNALFGWQDVDDARSGSKGYLVLNSHATRNGEIAPSIITACMNYGTVPIRWGIDQDEFIEELAA